ncbi:MAG TPA: aldolase/citrate lyase family protein [Chloroflexota bacterium]|nr:aldolase/citrate lyase family protein [Chloroflexota bacterium]
MSRVNRAVELLAQGQPIYYETVAERGYAGGKAAAATWADYVNYEMEHTAFDLTMLSDFMRGLVDGGPTRSGHRTPAVIVTLPTDGSSEHVIRANAWMVKQVLATGIHGILLCHAETASAVKAFVESARYPFNTIGLGEGLDVGRRGGGGQRQAAEIWGLEVADYLAKAEPWPLNPNGELLLGVKIENVRALENAETSARVPGIAFAEWGPGDMGMSMGYPDQHDEPYPAEMLAARSRVLVACKAAGLAFLNQVTPENIVERIAEGVMIGAGRQAREAAEVGRKHTGRAMPW